MLENESNNSHLVDEIILLKIKSADQEVSNEGWQGLYSKYASDLWRQIRRKAPSLSNADVDDIWAETWVAALKSISAFENRGEGAIFGWLRQVAFDTYSKRAEKYTRRKDILDNQYLPAESSSNFDSDVLLYEMLYEAIDKLPKNSKKVMLLFSEGYTHEEIANSLDLSLSNSKTTLHRGRKRVQGFLQGQGFDRKRGYALFPLWLLRRNAQNHANYLQNGSIKIDEGAKRLSDVIRTSSDGKELSYEVLSARADLQPDIVLALKNGLINSADVEPEWLEKLAKGLDCNVTFLKSALYGDDDPKRIENPEETPTVSRHRLWQGALLGMGAALVLVGLLLMLILSINEQGAEALELPSETPNVVLTLTPTSLVFTSTPLPVAIHTVVVTATPAPSITPTPPSALAVTASRLVNTQTMTPTPSPCVPNQDGSWVSYVIRAGDTVWSLATVTGTTINEVEQVNCLENTRAIVAGTIIFLPKLPPTPTPAPIILFDIELIEDGLNGDPYQEGYLQWDLANVTEAYIEERGFTSSNSYSHFLEIELDDNGVGNGSIEIYSTYYYTVDYRLTVVLPNDNVFRFICDEEGVFVQNGATPCPISP